MAVYIVKPLEWQLDYDRDDERRWSADTVFNTVYIYDDPDGGFRWCYCVDEYYDEGSNDCESLEAGKAAAEAWYLDRLMPALSPAPHLHAEPAAAPPSPDCRGVP